jgi:hypothetical protein
MAEGMLSQLPLGRFRRCHHHFKQQVERILVALKISAFVENFAERVLHNRNLITDPNFLQALTG